MSNISTTNPATGEIIKTYPLMSEQEAIAKLEAAHVPFLEWRTLSHADRAPYLSRIAQKLRDNTDDLAALMTQETGKLLKDGKREVEICAAILDYIAAHGPDALADEKRTHGSDG